MSSVGVSVCLTLAGSWWFVVKVTAASRNQTRSSPWKALPRKRSPGRHRSANATTGPSAISNTCSAGSGCDARDGRPRPGSLTPPSLPNRNGALRSCGRSPAEVEVPPLRSVRSAARLGWVRRRRVLGIGRFLTMHLSACARHGASIETLMSCFSSSSAWADGVRYSRRIHASLYRRHRGSEAAVRSCLIGRF